MPAQIFRDLYSLIVEAEPYLRAEIVIYTNTLPTGQPIAYGDLQQPANAGYAPMRANRLEDLFPDLTIVPGKAVRLVSRQIDMRNQSNGIVSLAGVALVVWLDVGTPAVIAAVNAPQTWRPGMRVSGRVHLTSNVFTQS